MEQTQPNLSLGAPKGNFTSQYKTKREQNQKLAVTSRLHVVAQNVDQQERLGHRWGYNISSSETGSTVARAGMEFTM